MTRKQFGIPLPHSERLLLSLSVPLILFGVWLAALQSWTCDDAYISFRYARNLVEGLGLVFNEGELVEGFTNLLWTLWIAAGLKLRFGPEGWANFWSLAAYAGSLGLLLLFHLHLRRNPQQHRIRAFPIPVALLLGLAHSDWRVWSTGGLETSAVTLLLLTAYLVATFGPLTRRRTAGLGLLMGVGLSLRPDVALAAAVLGVFILLTAPEPRRADLVYAVVFGSLALLLTLGRLWYYGDLVPNTYYAKSAAHAQYAQGTIYLMLYFHRYWPLLFSLLPFWSLRRHLFGHRRVPLPGSLGANIWLAAGLAIVHMLYLLRIGGDFMFARMLIPVTPLLLILVEIGLVDRPRENRVVKLGLTGFLLLGTAFSPALPSGSRWVAGVADERGVYSPSNVAALEREAKVLSRFIHDLPVRLLLIGAEARLAYRTRVPVAVDLHGLVDGFTARQPAVAGGRPGHNKFMPLSYAVTDRKMHLIFHSRWHTEEGVSAYIPEWPVQFDDLPGLILHWDEEIMVELKARGARFEDFPSFLDRYLQEADSLSSTRIRQDFENFTNFYFDHNDDPQRLGAFREILSVRDPAQRR